MPGKPRRPPESKPRSAAAQGARSPRDLGRYRGRRAAESTPEPFGASRGPRPGLFVVQEHGARRRHYDLRLEWKGVLLSWAVPRGPSLDPGVKRLAVHVEDHPVDYADFEGVIPEGNYGAGAVIVWDLGRWIPRSDPDAGLAAGKLDFELEGYKLRGRFGLVRSGGRKGRDTKEWLLVKKRDAYAVPEAEEGDVLGDASVLSGLTLDELREGADRERRVEKQLPRLGAKRRPVRVASVRPMLAQRIERPFSDPDWLFEIKIDGYRMIGAREDGEARLVTRNGRDATARFPEVARALAALPYARLVLDGEIAATDRDGRPRFQRLQQRALLERPREIERAAVEIPVTYFVFDLLGFGEYDLRDLPLEERKALLEELLPRQGPLRFVPHFAERGEAVYAELESRGLEGLVAKRADAPYRAGRSPLWRKLRALRSDDFVVVGFSVPRGTRSGFGALHLAGWRGGELCYAGRVGSGFSEAQLGEIRAALETLRRDTPPCSGAVPRTRGHFWVEPVLVCEVRYTEITGDGLLRQPVFLRLRDDKRPEECLVPGPEGADVAPSAPAEGGPAADTERHVPFTNLDKVFWPAEGYTKGDLIEYHRVIAPWLLPHLRDRPIVLTRHPDGIEGKSFFQKDAPAWVPSWVRTERIWSEHAQREVDYFVCDDVESLLYVVNLGTIPIHVWSSRVAALQHPDWCVLDLDPKGAPLADVVKVARRIGALCRDLALPSFVKSSGSTGLHVLLPLGGRLTYAQSRSFGELLARVVVQELPQIATVARRLSSRAGRVYVDYLQNGHGQLLVAPFSVRPLPGAPVSMPLRWSEVTRRLDLSRHHLGNAPARMERLGEDPLAPVLREQPDLAAALERLRERLAAVPVSRGRRGGGGGMLET